MRLLAPALLLLAGCPPEPPDPISPCDGGGEADDYVQGLQHAGDVFDVAFMDAEPAPPDVGINVWDVEILDGADLVEDGEVTAVPWMPLHGHGTVPARHDLTPAEDGTWFSRPINLFMPGLWVITFEIDDGVTTDEVEFRFCLEG